MINKLLEERGKTYGDHKAMYSLCWRLWEDMFNTVEFKRLEGWRKVELAMISLKQCRAIHNPKHGDSWDDIGGYAELAKGGSIPNEDPTTIARAICNSPEGFQCARCEYHLIAGAICQQSDDGLICERCAKK